MQIPTAERLRVGNARVLQTAEAVRRRAPTEPNGRRRARGRRERYDSTRAAAFGDRACDRAATTPNRSTPGETDPGMNPPPAASPDPVQKEAAFDPYAALRSPNYLRYWCGNFFSILGLRAMTVAVLWEIYDRTGSALALGYVGLVQVVPMVLLVLVAGAAADRFDRRRVLAATNVVVIVASALMAWCSYTHAPVAYLYVLLFFNAVGRAFQQPAKSALVPQLVPREQFPGAVKWNAAGFQLASVVGPTLGGYIVYQTGGAAAAYLVQGAGAALFLILLSSIRLEAAPAKTQRPTLAELGAGVAFVARSPLLLGAMALDMFAVLLGGAVALLPVYAKILGVGPRELGWMQGADAAGAVCMSVLLTQLPPFRRSGYALFSAVACFGLATIVFGLSRNFTLSMAMLFLIGAFDTISVVVRQTLIQLLTPDELRGRVSAVNGLFISISNELGGFESGLVAAWTSATFSVVSGGVGTIVVTAVVALLVPGLLHYGSLVGEPLKEETAPQSATNAPPPGKDPAKDSCDLGDPPLPATPGEVAAGAAAAADAASRPR